MATENIIIPIKRLSPFSLKDEALFQTWEVYKLIMLCYTILIANRKQEEYPLTLLTAPLTVLARLSAS